MTYADWSKPNGTIFWMVLRAALKRKFHGWCLLRMAWLSKRETYVFEELGGYRAWLWHVWQWMVGYIEYEPGICDCCSETLPKDTFQQKVRYIFS